VTADTYIVLARALAAAGRPMEAIAEYERALRAPSEAPAVAHTELSWLLATNPDDRARDGARAVQLAEKAETLGRTLAAAGGVSLRGNLDARSEDPRGGARRSGPFRRGGGLDPRARRPYAVARRVRRQANPCAKLRISLSSSSGSPAS
jgi:hypothetical protein